MRPFLIFLAVLAVFVPVQAAAEKYVLRGWLTQAAGVFLRSPWFAVLPRAALFATAHGWGTTWGFIDLLLFGLVAGWLTIRTGGLEASIALHVLNNLPAFGVSAVVDGLSSDDTAADAPWQLALANMTTALLYAAIILRMTRRHRPQHLAPAVATRPEAPLPNPYPRPFVTPPPAGMPRPYDAGSERGGPSRAEVRESDLKTVARGCVIGTTPPRDATDGHPSGRQERAHREQRFPEIPGRPQDELARWSTGRGRHQLAWPA